MSITKCYQKILLVIIVHTKLGTYIEGKNRNLTFKLALGQVGVLPLAFFGGLDV